MDRSLFPADLVSPDHRTAVMRARLDLLLDAYDEARRKYPANEALAFLDPAVQVARQGWLEAEVPHDR